MFDKGTGPFFIGILLGLLGIYLQGYLPKVQMPIFNENHKQQINQNIHIESNGLINDIKKELYQKKFLHLCSYEMKTVLKRLGANEEDLETYLKDVYNNKIRAMDPAVQDRYTHSRNFLYQKEHADQNVEEIFRNNASVLPHVASTLNDPAFIALNGGLNYRPVAKLDDSAVFNSVHTALHKFVVSLLNPETKKLPLESSKKNEFLVSDFLMKNVLGNNIRKSQLSPEGIHQDGNHITMMMLAVRNNIAPETGKSRVFTLNAKSGPYGIAGGRKNLTEDESRKEEEEREQFMLFDRVLLDPFDTLITLDQEVKHEARGAIVRTNENEIGERGMFLIFARRPNADGWQKPEEGIPLAIGREEFNSKGSLDHLLSNSEQEFKNHERLFFENLKKTGPSFPGQDVTNRVSWTQ